MTREKDKILICPECKLIASFSADKLRICPECWIKKKQKIPMTEAIAHGNRVFSRCPKCRDNSLISTGCDYSPFKCLSCKQWFDHINYVECAIKNHLPSYDVYKQIFDLIKKKIE